MKSAAVPQWLYEQNWDQSGLLLLSCPLDRQPRIFMRYNPVTRKLYIYFCFYCVINSVYCPVNRRRKKMNNVVCGICDSFLCTCLRYIDKDTLLIKTSHSIYTNIGTQDQLSQRQINLFWILTNQPIGWEHIFLDFVANQYIWYKLLKCLGIICQWYVCNKLQGCMLQ